MTRFKHLTEIDREKFGRPSSPAAESAAAEEACADLVRPPLLAGEALEAFIGMRDGIWKLASERPLRVIGVTSSRELEGKTRVAVGLALTFAMDPRRRVLLVDGNLRAPAVASTFQIPRSPGLTDLVLGNRPLNEVLCRLEGFPLHIMTSGESELTPAEIYSYPRFARRMAEVRENYDVTIVDTPGVKKYPDFEFFSKHLDGTILVMESDKTQLSLIQEIRGRIEATGVPILGVAINRVKNPIPDFLNRRFGLD
jgi:capsular exopolysaccharide synthesis family protein